MAGKCRARTGHEHRRAPPDVGASLLTAITGVLKAVEVEELAKRLEALEGKKNEPANA